MTSEPSTPSSSRVMLAAVAHQAVTGAPGIVLTAGEDNHWVTVDRDHRIDGVTAVAQPDGRIELGLYIEVAWPPEPLRRLGDDLRARVHAAAVQARLDRDLGDVLVTIAGVEDPFSTGAIA